MDKYVVGLLFSNDCHHVILIKKNRPAWQVGLLNGVGGRIEEDETPLECMIREFKEEAGEKITEWEEFTTISDGVRWKVHFFKAFTSKKKLLTAGRLSFYTNLSSCLITI